MRTLAIDLGTRRVGLALSDEGAQFASPYGTLNVTSAESAMDAVIAVVIKEGVRRIVLGLPINMDESIGSAAASTLKWGRTLAARSAKPVVFVDERLSSFTAEQQLSARKRDGERLTNKGKKKQLDALVAATFLQEYLDGKLPAIEAPR